MLGGVRIEHTLGLAGHSDADALLHAIIDAILGAAGLGDIGEQFPDTDERYRDADSTKLLEQVIQWITKRGLSVTNVDATVITQAPKLAPYKMAMRQRIAFLLGLEIQAVSVKAKTNEGMGWIGSGEGLAVVAVVMLGKGPADLSGQVGSVPEEVPLVDRPMPTEPVGPPALPIDGHEDPGQGEPMPNDPVLGSVWPGSLVGVSKAPMSDEEGPSAEDLRESQLADVEEEEDELVRCRQCGSQTSADNDHCPRCGRDMKSSLSSGGFIKICLGIGVIVAIVKLVAMIVQMR